MKNAIRIPGTMILIAVSLCIFVSYGIAQQTMLLTESFEAGNGATPPAGWAVEQA